jgi:hypothetical protein
MPEKWIESAGPSENEMSKKAFEAWWSLQFGTLHLEDKMQLLTKKIAFNAWEHQRQHCSDLIKQILSTIKEST